MKIDKEVLEEVAMALDHATKELSRSVLNNQLEAYFSASEKLNEVIEALAQQSEPEISQEPAMWIAPSGEGFRISLGTKKPEHAELWEAVYLAPPDYEALKARVVELEGYRNLAVSDLHVIKEERDKLQTRVAELDKTIGQVIEDTAKELECEPDNEAILIAARDLKLRVAELEGIAIKTDEVITEATENVIQIIAERDKLQSECDQLKKRLSVWNAK